MPILTMGTSLTDEIEAGLHLTTIVNPAQQDGAEITRIVRAAEGFVKSETKRNFEEITRTAEAYDVDPGTSELLLSDWPATLITSLEQVTIRHDDGTFETSLVSPGSYVVDKAAGIITLLYGATFAPGPQSVLVSWKSGYTQAEIIDNAKGEIHVLKQLLLSIIAHWYQMHKEGGGGHIQSISLPTGENLAISFDLTPEEKRMINQLRRW
jgi:hypothetical protein